MPLLGEQWLEDAEELRRSRMSLASDYQRQSAWRAWPTIFDALPPLGGQTVLDLGCGVGDLAAELVARGARVIGVDINEELLREARSRRLANAEFWSADLRTLPDLGAQGVWDGNHEAYRGTGILPVNAWAGSPCHALLLDGLWCSFTAAYFPNLPAMLALWARRLLPGGWIALTEIDDLFGHQPLSARTTTLFESYAQDALAAGRYDFHMGRKRRDYLERAGFTVTKVLTLKDQELSFDGPAHPEVVDAWRARLERMKLLRDFCGADFERLRAEFLGCLTRADHRCAARVCCCIATR